MKDKLYKTHKLLGIKITYGGNLETEKIGDEPHQNTIKVIEDCIIDNSNNNNNKLCIIDNNFRNLKDQYKNIFIIKNCTLLNGTYIADDNMLSNDMILWDLENNISR